MTLLHRSNRLLILSALAGIAVLLALGAWQVKRLAWKEQLIALREHAVTAEPVKVTDIEAGIENGFDVDLLRTTATGYYRHDLERHVYHLRDGVIGWKVVTPFIVPGRFILLVDRGFVPDAQKDAASRPGSVKVAALTGEIKAKPQQDWPQQEQIAAYVRTRAGEPAWFLPDNDPANNRWYSYDLAAMSQTFPDDLGVLAPDQFASMLAVFLQVEPGGEPGTAELPIVDPLDVKLKNNHLQYAITWFSLAAVFAVMTVFFVRSRRKREDDS